MIIFPSCPHNNSLSVFAIKIGKIVIRLIILQCIPFNYNKLSYVQKVMLKCVSIVIRFLFIRRARMIARTMLRARTHSILF